MICQIELYPMYQLKFLDSELKWLISEYEFDLAKAGVDLDDEDLQFEINANFQNLEGAILALLQASAKGQLEYPNRYFSKALRFGWKGRDWVKPPSYPVRTAADFDLGQSEEERAANYQRLRQMTVAIASEFSVNPGGGKSIRYYEPEFFSRCPTLEEIQAAWSNPAFKAEVEKSIDAHPVWGYAVVDGEIQEVNF